MSETSLSHCSIRVGIASDMVNRKGFGSTYSFFEPQPSFRDPERKTKSTQEVSANDRLSSLGTHRS